MLICKNTHNKMHLASGVTEAVSTLRTWKTQGQKIALVPTMGALHDGHLSLVQLAAQAADKVVVSIFINPTQFAASEDYSKYPRQEESDLKLLAENNVDLAYLPTKETMYGTDFQTTVGVGEIGNILCGASRPGHFDGVATIVAKLLLQTMPDIAFFGEKDYQQLQLIKRMVSDLNIPVSIESGPTIRETDGLAMSSRNTYLSAKERQTAPAIFATLNETKNKLLSGELSTDDVSAFGTEQLRRSGFNKIDYFELRDAETLENITSISKPARLLVAAFLSKNRLIDNISIEL